MRLAIPFLLTAVVAALCLLGCGGSSQATIPPLAPEVITSPEPGGAEPAFTPVPGPVTVRVMSYNVLWGGGFDRRFDANLLEWQKPLFTGRDRLASILDLLDGQQPDVLGIQEAAAWDEGSPPVVQQAASRLGLRYAMAKNPYQINTALLSRYRILDWLDLTSYMGSNSGLIATLQAPDGGPLVVAVVHLDPFTSRQRACQLDIILSVLQQLPDQRVLLLGDMNFRPTAAEFQKLITAGWQALAIERTLPIDQVWTRAGAGVTTEPLWPAEAGLGLVDGQRLSDHYPVGVLVTFPEAVAPAAALALPKPSLSCPV